MDQPIVEFLLSLSLPILILFVILVVFMIDVCYALWVRRTAEGKAVQSAFWSALIYIFSVTAFTGILEISNLLIFPALIGGWLGTYLTVKFDHKKKS